MINKIDRDQYHNPNDISINTQKIGKGALHLTVAKITTTVIALLSSMLLSRFRTLEEYGTYSQMITVITLAASFFMMGLPNSCNYFLARADNYNQRRNFLSVYYTLNTLICGLIGIVLVIMTPMIEVFFENPKIHLFWYFLAFYPFANITISGISNVLVVYGKTQKLMLINVITASVALISVIATQILGGSFADYLRLFLAGNCTIAIWNYIIVFRLEKGVKPQIRSKLVKSIFVYSIPIGLATLVGTIDIELDKLMIGRMMGSESFALYANAGKELPLTMISASLTAVLLPQMARKLKENDNIDAVALWGKTIELSYIAMSFFATALIVFAPQVISLLYSNKYLPGVSVFRVYSLVLLLRTTYFGIVLNSSGKTKYVFWSSVVTLLVNCGLNYLLYIAFGFVGPSIATFVSIAVCDICQLYLTCRLLGMRWRHIFPWKRLGYITIVNIIWGAFACIVVHIVGLQTETKDIFFCIIIGVLITAGYIVFMKKKIFSLWKDLNC